MVVLFWFQRFDFWEVFPPTDEVDEVSDFLGFVQNPLFVSWKTIVRSSQLSNEKTTWVVFQ